MKRVIPRHAWRHFVRDFGNRHHGWLVTLDGGGHGLPLEGLALQLDHGREVLAVIVRQDARPHGHVLRSIDGPVRLTLEGTGAGEEKTLSVETAGHARTRVVFRPVPVPDMETASKRLFHG